jgi:hypothetical protein
MIAFREEAAAQATLQESSTASLISEIAVFIEYTFYLFEGNDVYSITICDYLVDIQELKFFVFVTFKRINTLFYIIKIICCF